MDKSEILRKEQVEKIKAKDRQEAGVSLNSDKGRYDDIVAESTGFGSRDSLRKAKFIDDNADVTEITLMDFAEKNIVPGSTINSDAFSSYYALAKSYDHQPLKFNIKENPDHLKWMPTIISNAKAFIGVTYHGLDAKHLQAYLHEFCYRFNRRTTWK